MIKDFSKYFIVGTNSDALHDTMNGSVVGELIRCWDCKNREAKNGFCKGRGWPMQLVPDDDFCSKAEPKEKET